MINFLIMHLLILENIMIVGIIIENVLHQNGVYIQQKKQ